MHGCAPHILGICVKYLQGQVLNTCPCFFVYGLILIDFTKKRWNNQPKSE